VKLDTTGITKINVGAFYASINLESITVTLSPITLVEAEAFCYLPKVQKIDLSKNEIRSFQAAAFKDLTSLKKIEFNQNPITTLPIGLFNNIAWEVDLDFKDCDKLVPDSNTIRAFCNAPKATINIKGCDLIKSQYSKNAFKDAINNACGFTGGNSDKAVKVEER
jgi:Leucine-rich repeat (LRR) protein